MKNSLIRKVHEEILKRCPHGKGIKMYCSQCVLDLIAAHKEDQKEDK